MAAGGGPRLRLLHIRDEIEDVEHALKGVTFENFERSYVLRRAVERALEIISEAARALPAELRGRFPEAPWPAIMGLGNVLRHEFMQMDEHLLWDAATAHLPQLHPIILRMLEELQ